MHALRSLAKPTTALLLLLVFHGAFNLYWLANDNRPDMGDEAQHRIFAEGYSQALHADTSLYWRAKYFFKSRTAIYPPLFHAASAALAYPFGTSALAYGLLNTLVFLGLIVVMYEFGKMYRDASFGLLVAVLTSFTPFLLGLSRVFLTDLLSCLFVALAMTSLVRSEHFTRTRPVLLFAVVNALGFWVRWITALYYAVPLAYAVVRAIVRALGRRPRLAGLRGVARNCAITLAVALVVAGPWYWPRVSVFMDTYHNYFKKLGAADTTILDAPDDPVGHAALALPGAPASLPAVVLNMALGMAEEGSHSSQPPRLLPFEKRRVLFRLDSPEIWSTYLLIIVNKGLFLPITVIALAGMAVSWRDRKKPVVQYALLWVLGSYVLLTLGWYFRSPAPRYAAQMLPALAFFAAVALYAISNRRLRHAAITLVLLVQLLQFWNQTIGGLGRFGRIELPWARGHHVITNSFDEGVAVIKDAIDGSGAKIGPIFRGVNWIDRSMTAMVGNELERDYVAWPEARVNLVALRKAAIESVQRKYWPRPDPLSEDRQPFSRTFVGPYHSILDSVVAPGSVVVSPADGAEAGSTAWLVQFEAPVRLDAYSVAIPGVRAAVHAQYWSERGGAYAGITPDPAAAGGGKSFVFHAFETIETDRLLFVVTSQTEAALAVDHLDFYRYIEQPRAPVLVQNPEQLTAPQQVAALDYVILPHAANARETALLQEFFVLDTFRAKAWTYWDEREFNVFARSQPPLILLDNTPGLRISTTGDHADHGRWDIPWWRFPQFSAPGYEEDQGLYWAAAAPAVIEADLGGEYEVLGLEVVPFSEEQGVGAAYVDYWDAAGGVWHSLDRAEVIGHPKHEPGKPPTQWRQFLPRWDRGIHTTKVRLRLSQGPPGDLANIYVAHIYLYGRALDSETRH